MTWTSLQFAVDGKAAEAWADALLEAGAIAVDVVDADAGTERETPQFGEPGLANHQADNEFGAGVWQHNLLTALFAEGVDVAALIAQLSSQLGYAIPVVYQLAHLDDEDWVRKTQAQFHPIQISKCLWILPSWHEPPDHAAINLIVDPGLAFGTGSHATTHLCLAWLDDHIDAKAQPSVLDYGCGSGILAIAAKCLGAGKVVGTDIDPQALISATANAKTNHADCVFVNIDQLDDAAEVQPTQFDVVVANILTNPLMVLAPLLAARVVANGRIVLSGVLVEQADEVIAVYRQWFPDMRCFAQRDGWALLSGSRIKH